MFGCKKEGGGQPELGAGRASFLKGGFRVFLSPSLASCTNKQPLIPVSYLLPQLSILAH